ncbi:MAG: MYG1 family protein [Patescibacteria group bacterium]
MIKIATHSGGFHTDDVFAVATLQLVHGVENVEIIRTRDESLLASADIVVDVGGVYDVATKRFDHHQIGGPVRDNGIPYAAFGLVWKEYGESVAGSKENADDIERSMVLAVDAGDQGVSLYDLKNPDIPPFELYQITRSFLPEWGSNKHNDVAFSEAVEFARALLKRIIVKKQAEQKMKELVREVYNNTSDKRVLVFDIGVSTNVCTDYPEVLLVVQPDDPLSNNNWIAKTVTTGKAAFEGRVNFPKEWLGLTNGELAEISGISDAVFCHKAGFIFVAGSKEGVIKAVEKVVG